MSAPASFTIRPLVTIVIIGYILYVIFMAWSGEDSLWGGLFGE